MAKTGVTTRKAANEAEAKEDVLQATEATTDEAAAVVAADEAIEAEIEAYEKQQDEPVSEDALAEFLNDFAALSIKLEAAIKLRAKQGKSAYRLVEAKRHFAQIARSIKDYTRC